ncbi:MAG: hypothetical protein HYV63_32755 [Candidatus Schekmanbacteria bacterium]|nr:hypothetical protein [Candidatus Schekmanbacteria bacterium]
MVQQESGADRDSGIGALAAGLGAAIRLGATLAVVLATAGAAAATDWPNLSGTNTVTVRLKMKNDEMYCSWASGYFTQYTNSDKKNLFIAYDEANSAYVDTLIVMFAGQQGIGGSGSGNQSAVTGQEGYNSWEFYDSCSGSATLINGALFPRIRKAASTSGNAFYDNLLFSDRGSIKRNVTWALFFDHQFDVGNSNEYKDQQLDDVVSWVKSLAHGSGGGPGNVKRVILSGASRGGALALRLGKKLANDSAWSGVRLYVATFDALLNCTSGDYEAGCTDELIDNPLSSDGDYAGAELDVYDYYVDSGSSFNEEENLRVFQIVGGEQYWGYHAFAAPTDSRENMLSYRQRWVDLSHTTICQNTDTQEDNTINPVMDWLNAALQEEDDDSWRFSYGATDIFDKISTENTTWPKSADKYLFGNATYSTKTDVIRPTGEEIRIYSYVLGSYEGYTLNPTNTYLATLGIDNYVIGDFNADGIDDILAYYEPYDRYHICYMQPTPGSIWDGYSARSYECKYNNMASTGWKMVLDGSALFLSWAKAADVDDDGDDDLVIFTAGGIGYFTNYRDSESFGSLHYFTDNNVTNASLFTSTNYHIGDIDGDGRDEAWLVCDEVAVFGCDGHSDGVVVGEFHRDTVDNDDSYIDWHVQYASTFDASDKLRNSQLSDIMRSKRVLVADYFDAASQTPGIGDGCDDLLISSGTAFWVAPSECDGNLASDELQAESELQSIGPHTYQQFTTHYCVSDFNADGTDDVFFAK